MIWLNLGRTVFAATITATAAASTQDTTMPTMRLTLRLLPFFFVLVLDVMQVPVSGWFLEEEAPGRPARRAADPRGRGLDQAAPRDFFSAWTSKDALPPATETES